MSLVTCLYSKCSFEPCGECPACKEEQEIEEQDQFGDEFDNEFDQWFDPEDEGEVKVRTRPLPPCGNPQCCVSTGIMEEITFGSGKLSFNGYWEFPCNTCARDWEQKYPEDICWPYRS